MEKHHAFWWAIIVVAGLFTGLYGVELLELSQSTQLQLSSAGDSLTGFAVSDGVTGFTFTGQATTELPEIVELVGEQVSQVKFTAKKINAWNPSASLFKAGDKVLIVGVQHGKSGSSIKLSIFAYNYDDYLQAVENPQTPVKELWKGEFENVQSKPAVIPLSETEEVILYVTNPLYDSRLKNYGSFVLNAQQITPLELTADSTQKTEVFEGQYFHLWWGTDQIKSNILAVSGINSKTGEGYLSFYAQPPSGEGKATSGIVEMPLGKQVDTKLGTKKNALSLIADKKGKNLFLTFWIYNPNGKPALAGEETAEEPTHETPAVPAPVLGGVCPTSLSSYDVNKDGVVDENDLQNFVAANPTLTGKAGVCTTCPICKVCPSGTGGAGEEAPTEEQPVVETPECGKLADCKVKQECNKKQLADGNICIWSLVAGEKTVNDKRKGECSSLTACINLEGKCHEPDVFYTNKYICGGNNEWIACGTSNNGKASLLGTFTCDGTKWVETAKIPVSVGTPPPAKVDNPPVITILSGGFLGKKSTYTEGTPYTGYVLAQDPDGDAITKFEITSVKPPVKSKLTFAIDDKGTKDGVITKSTITWSNPLAGTYEVTVKVTSGTGKITKSTSKFFTVVIKKKPIIVPGIGANMPKGVASLAVCNTLADCKKNEICKGQKIKNEYCIWSLHEDDVTAGTEDNPARKGLCPKIDQCITKAGSCINLNVKLGSYACGTNNVWAKPWVIKTPAETEAKLLSPSSVVKVDLGKDATDEWLHIGDEKIDTFKDKDYTLPSNLGTYDLKFKLPYIIGDNYEVFFKAKGVSDSSNYNTEVNIFNENHEIISSLYKQLGSKNEDDSGYALAYFDKKKLKYTVNSNIVAYNLTKDSILRFDLGVQGNDYDDIEITDVYVKTGIVYDDRAYFGDQNLVSMTKTVSPYTNLETNTAITPSKNIMFNSGINLKSDDKVKLRFFVYGIHPGKEKYYITTFKINTAKYTLNKDLPATYSEKDFNLGEAACHVFFPDDLTVIDAEIKPEDIKLKDNLLVITAGKKITSGKTEIDNFIIDRIEVVVNEDKVPGNSYAVKTASINFKRGPCLDNSDYS